MDKKNKKENRIKKLGMNVKNWFTGNLKASTKQTVALLIILLVAIISVLFTKNMFGDAIQTISADLKSIKSTHQIARFEQDSEERKSAENLSEEVKNVIVAHDTEVYATEDGVTNFFYDESRPVAQKIGALLLIFSPAIALLVLICRNLKLFVFATLNLFIVIPLTIAYKILKAIIVEIIDIIKDSISRRKQNSQPKHSEPKKIKVQYVG